MLSGKNKKLYHYTSVDTLLSILRTQKLRFNNLTAMDDPEEAKSIDSYNAGRWVFTSSWTTLRDNKLMFQNYGLNGKGVCISLPKYPFYTIYGNPIQKNKFLMNAITYVEPVNFTRGTEIYSEKYNLLFLPAKVEEIAVDYTNDENLLYPKVVTPTNRGLSYFDGLLGQYKDLKWKYQSEVRYRLRPTLMSDIHDPKSKYDFNQMMLNAIYTKISDDCPVHYIDIPIKIRNMEIIIGSKVGEDKKLEIKKYAEKYITEFSIFNSNIRW